MQNTIHAMNMDASFLDDDQKDSRRETKPRDDMLFST